MSRKSPLLVALALLAGGALAGCGADEPAATDEPSPGATSSSAAPSSLELVVPAAQTGRCMAPNVDNLQAQDTAFEGVVTAAADGTATLAVNESFKGADVDTVTVSTPSPDLTGELLAVDFRADQTYLVSSLDGQVSVCGLSGAKDDLLADLYAQAYAG